MAYLHVKHPDLVLGAYERFLWPGLTLGILVLLPPGSRRNNALNPTVTFGHQCPYEVVQWV